MATNTTLTRLLGIRLPVVSAPMAFASTPEMAAAVTAAGGFGFIGAGFDSPAQLKNAIASARTLLKIADTDPVPIGFGFIQWILEMTEPSDEPRLPAVLAEKPVALWFAFGDELDKYISQVREFDSHRDHKTVVFVMVHTVEQATRAANVWKADVIVTQGIEAGGHGFSESLPTHILLEGVVQAIPNRPPIIAAGGISDGRQIASLLKMGAAGCVLGTRFLTSDECQYSDAQKDALISTGPGGTIRTLAFDEVMRTNRWPKKYDGRAVFTKIIDDEREGCSLEERLKRFEESKVAEDDDSRLIIWAGEGSQFLHKREKTADIMKELERELRMGY